MIQREIRHPAGTFPSCRCGAQPRHIEARGSSSRESFDPRHPTGTRHSLECPCHLSTCTQWFATLEAATREWREHFAAPVAHASVRPLLRLHHNKESA